MTKLGAQIPRSLDKCDWLNRSETQAIFQAIEAVGGEALVVGGAVRNALLGRPAGDIDFATSLRPDALIEAAQSAGHKTVPTGIDHGTVSVIVAGYTFEVTTLREDVETFGRQAKVVYGDDWTKDAARRDFTINALYADSEGRLFDPLGGYDDIVQQRVRFIGAPRQRIEEDYLRILRFFRFTAEYGAGHVDEAGLLACVMERHGLKRLSAERIWREFCQLLSANRAEEMVQKMFEHGLLLDIIETPPQLHRFKKLIALERAQNLPADAIRRLAALTITVKEDGWRLAALLRLSKADGRRLVQFALDESLIRQEMTVRDGRAALYRLGPQTYLDQLLMASAAGEEGTWEAWDALLSLPDRWTVPKFPLTGHDARQAGVPEGVQMGKVLDAVEAWWVGQDFPKDVEALKRKLLAAASKACC